MKYASIDIETTGLNPEIDTILSIAVVIEDTKTKLPLEDLPKIVLYNNLSRLTGDIFALGMNRDTLFKIASLIDNDFLAKDYELLLHSHYLLTELAVFLNKHFDGKVLVAGKNFNAFDKRFLDSLSKTNIITDMSFFHHRTLDPSMLFIDFEKDSTPPSLSECKKRAGFEEEVSHDALEDALDVIRLLRKFY